MQIPPLVFVVIYHFGSIERIIALAYSLDLKIWGVRSWAVERVCECVLVIGVQYVAGDLRTGCMPPPLLLRHLSCPLPLASLRPTRTYAREGWGESSPLVNTEFIFDLRFQKAAQALEWSRCSDWGEPGPRHIMSWGGVLTITPEASGAREDLLPRPPRHREGQGFALPFLLLFCAQLSSFTSERVSCWSLD